METEEQIIEEDRRSNPKCNYSVSAQQSCSTDSKGDFVCSSLRQIFRHCPGVPAVSIFSHKTEGRPEADSHAGVFPGGPSLADVFGGLFGGDNRRNGERELHDALRQFEQEIDRHRSDPDMYRKGQLFPFFDDSNQPRGLHSQEQRKIPRGYLEGPPQDV